MKRITILAIFLYLTVIIVAQAPLKMSYQAVIRDNQGALVKSHSIRTRIHIIQGNTQGVSLYVELHNTFTNENGLLNLVIGDGTVVSGDLTGIDWAAGPYFIKTETDPSGENNFSITHVSQLLSVPYALYAEKSGDGFSGSYYDLSDKPDFTNWDKDVMDDFSGNYNDLTNQPTFAPISDTSISTASVWSSTKTSTELDLKANVADVYTKSALQTLGQAGVHYGNLINKPANIDEDKTDDVTLTGNQTIGGTKTFDNILIAANGINAGNQRISNVASPVNTQDVVNKAYADQLLIRIEQLESSLNRGSFVDSRDNTLYNWIKIGNQIWMAQNLAYLPTVSPAVTESLASPVYYVYGYNGSDVIAAKSSQNYQNGGVLYNWPAAMFGSSSSTANPSGVQGVCPSGWHLPSDAEWTQLANYLGGTDVAGGKLKQIGTTFWTNPNSGATNSSNFSAIGTGIREGAGNFNYQFNYTLIWSATQFDSNNAYRIQLRYNASSMDRYYDTKEYGYSVRCLKNQ